MFLILLLLITVLYNSYVIYKYKKIPVSLSETSYMFGGIKRYFFTLYCLSVGAITLPYLFRLNLGDFEFMPFLFITGLLFAGFSPMFKQSIDREVHYTGAIISFLAFITFMFLYFPYYLIILYSILYVMLICWKRNCYVYFAEILSILMLNIWLLCNIQ